jgi:DNA-binding response OmpR family regulator
MQPTAQNHSRRSVLVVEDDPELNSLVGAYAQICGFHYVSALNGARALFEARENIPSAIILDLMLPDIDGFEICRRLKKDPTTSHIPVIILTALDDPAQRDQGRACGAAEYLTKPFDPDRLIQSISQHANEGNTTSSKA